MNGTLPESPPRPDRHGGVEHEAPGSPCFVHQAVRISAKTDTAATRSASDIGTRTGSSIVTCTVLEPCPPRSPLAM
jgi:hypothetical protein